MVYLRLSALKSTSLLLAISLLLSGCHAQSAASFKRSMEEFLAKDEGVEIVAAALERHYIAIQEKKIAQHDAAVPQAIATPVQRLDIEVGQSPVRGNAHARVTIINFADFECPFCARGAERMQEVLKLYPRDVRWVFKNLPLPGHAHAQSAAQAAMAAGRQGKFWEYHDLLYANRASLSEAAFSDFAKQLSLDLRRFERDIHDPQLQAQIEAEARFAFAHGIAGTPTFFINGKLLEGAASIEEFKAYINTALRTR